MQYKELNDYTSKQVEYETLLGKLSSGTLRNEDQIVTFKSSGESNSLILIFHYNQKSLNLKRL